MPFSLACSASALVTRLILKRLGLVAGAFRISRTKMPTTNRPKSHEQINHRYVCSPSVFKMRVSKKYLAR